MNNKPPTSPVQPLPADGSFDAVPVVAVAWWLVIEHCIAV